MKWKGDRGGGPSRELHPGQGVVIILIRVEQGGDFPEVQWLRLCFCCRGPGFDPWGTKMPHAVLCIQKFLFKTETETGGNTQ